MAQDAMLKMMMGKKNQGKTLSDSEKKSKLEALMGMKGLADSHMGNKLKNLKKVTVASNSPEGLKAGLHKAEDMTDETNSDNEDSDMHGEMAKFSEGGNVYDRGDSGGHVAKMPEEFDTDLDNSRKEDEEMGMKTGHDATQHGYADGTSDAGMDVDPSDEQEGSEDQDSVDELVQESPNDPDQLEELIQKLQEKCDSLKQQ